uniref:Disintegrin domain-containing protein n=1 Tax=Ditylum brightwellii TaxID=49249 RepID=A0A7S4SYQ1_9STRA
MPKSGCTRAQFFSNPNGIYNNDPNKPMGHAYGSSPVGPTDNARRLTEVAAHIAALYQASTCTVDGDCNDGVYCNGAETCGGGVCQPGTPVVCDDGVFCNGAETCNESTNSCNAGTPVVCNDGLYCNGVETCNEVTDSCDAGTPVVCDDGVFCNGAETCNEATNSCDAGTDPCNDGNQCTADACFEEIDSCVNDPIIDCCGNGVCETNEDCTSCADDCPSGTFGATECGNNICEKGETCQNCPADCNGVTGGKPSGRYCCSGGPGGNCESRCTSSGNTCSLNEVTEVQYCCGDGTCNGSEDSTTCEIDCPVPVCGDSVCDGDETACSCPQDCGSAPSSEVGLCNNGIDDNCDGTTDCDDATCANDPFCTTTCNSANTPCTNDIDADLCCNGCSGGKPSSRVCL